MMTLTLEALQLIHFAWRNDARGKAVAWWLAKLRTSATRAALTA